jgi:hypothetical protein
MLKYPQKCLHVKSALLLFDFNKKCNNSTNFNKSHKYQISLNWVELFLSYYMPTDRHIGANLLISATFLCYRNKTHTYIHTVSESLCFLLTFSRLTK